MQESRRRRRKGQQVISCVKCHVVREPSDLGWAKLKSGWKCKSCRMEAAIARRKGTASKLLDKATTSTVVRDGRTFVVHTLLAKKR